MLANIIFKNKTKTSTSFDPVLNLQKTQRNKFQFGPAAEVYDKGKL